MRTQTQKRMITMTQTQFDVAEIEGLLVRQLGYDRGCLGYDRGCTVDWQISENGVDGVTLTHTEERDVS